MLKPFLKTCLFLSAAVLVVIAAGYTSAPTLAAGPGFQQPRETDRCVAGKSKENV